jgi:hypothetical protein
MFFARLNVLTGMGAAAGRDARRRCAESPYAFADGYPDTCVAKSLRSLKSTPASNVWQVK